MYQNSAPLVVFALSILLLLPMGQAKGPSRDNKLFIECAIKGPKQADQEPETVVSHAVMSRGNNNRVIFFGLGGNLFVGNGELKEVCKEDKEFAQSSKAAPAMKQSAVEKCEHAGGLSLRGGKAMKFITKKHADFDQCYAGQYELFSCTKQACGGNEKLVLLEKTTGSSAKSYAFVHAGKLLVKELIFAELSADQLQCVRKACPKDSLPVVQEVIRWKAKGQKAAEAKGKFKVYKECAVKRKREGASPDGTRLETLMGHMKMDKQVLFFGMGGNLYAADSVLASECMEDKYFTKSNLSSMHSAFLGCNKASPQGGKAKISIRTGKAGGGGKVHVGLEEKLQLEVSSSKHAKGSQCQAKHARGQFDIYKCPKEACGGKDQVLLVKKKENAKNKLVSGGKLLVEEVLWAEIAHKQWQCVQELCGHGTRIPVVEAGTLITRTFNSDDFFSVTLPDLAGPIIEPYSKRKQDKSGKTAQQEAEAQHQKRNKKRRGRKPTSKSGKGSAGAGETKPAAKDA